MADEQKSGGQVSREQLIELLNEDLAREYQAIIAYVVYSQMLKGAEYMAIAKELEKHAGEELQHALTVSKTCFGSTSTTKMKPCATIASV
jgi:bacterioferritin